MPPTARALLLASVLTAVLGACGSDDEDVDYEAVCRDHVASTHPLLEPELDAVSSRVDEGMVTMRLTSSRNPRNFARCDIPVGTSEVVTAGIGINA
jgi:hypothetical protein